MNCALVYSICFEHHVRLQIITMIFILHKASVALICTHTDVYAEAV